MSSKQQRRGKVLTKEQKQEKAAKEKRLSLTKEKILSLKREVLKIVEYLLEEDISSEWLLKHCVKLCQEDYNDVIQERSIEHLCGYPLCNNPIVQVYKQQYHISRASNKVYDLTERKCFCCNECYKASNYLKAQLSEVPLHLRQSGMPIRIHLISEKDNRGSAGEEVVFRVSLDKDEIEKPCTSGPIHLSNILQEDVKGFEEHLSKLKITENVYEKPFVFSTDALDQTASEKIETQENASDSSEIEDFEDSSEEENFPEYNNLSVLSNKHMPIPEKTKKAVLIQPIKAVTVPKTNNTCISIDFIAKIFYDWFTEDTLKYLVGERKLYSMKADLLFQRMINSEAALQDELSSVKNEYIDLCLKVDSLPEQECSDSAEFGIDASGYSLDDKIGKLDHFSEDSSISKSVSGINDATSSIPKRRTKKKTREKKAVSFAPKVKNVSKAEFIVPDEDSNSLPISDPTFPLVDSVSQNALRRKVLIGKLKSVYFNALAVAGLHYRDIREGVMKIVETFSLSPTNISYKPKEWKCIALILLRILTKTTLEDLEDFEDAQFDKLCKTVLKDLGISVSDIDNLVSDLISEKQLLRIQS